MEKNILEIENISYAIDGRTILGGCSLSAHPGEFIGFLGPNGAGKSTFLKCVRGLLTPTGGNVRLFGRDTKELSDKEIARGIAFMQQDFHLSFGYTGREIVLSARYPYLKWWQKENQNDMAIAEKWMAYTGTTAFADKPIQALSGGEKQRIMLAKVLAQETPILFLDEPTAALDLLYQEEIFRLCRELAGSGKTILMICHDLMMAAKWCTRLVILSDSHFIADGRPGDVLTEDNLKKAFHLDALVYRDPITNQPTLYTYRKRETEHEPILLLGTEKETVTLMRCLFLAGYRPRCGYLPKGTLARKAAETYHLPFAETETAADTFSQTAGIIISLSAPIPDTRNPSANIYTGETISFEELLTKIENYTL